MLATVQFKIRGNDLVAYLLVYGLNEGDLATCEDLSRDNDDLTVVEEHGGRVVLVKLGKV